MLRQVVLGTVDVWVEGSSVVVVQVSKKDEVIFWLAAGEMDEVLSLMRQVLDAAREHGYSRAHMIGRRGWERVLRRDGWTPGMIHLTTEI